jgi:hypothetical protein
LRTKDGFVPDTDLPDRSIQPNESALVETLIIAGAAIAIVGSFLRCFPNVSSAWATGAFPIVTLVPIYCAGVASQVAIERFGGIELPAEVGLGFTWRRLQAALGALALLMMVAWVFVPPRRSAGLWVMLAGAAVVCAATIARARREPEAAAASRPPATGLTPGGIALLAGAAALVVGSFLDFWKVTSTAAGFGGGFDAWSLRLGFAPVSLIPVGFAVVLAVYVLVADVGRVPATSPVAQARWAQAIAVLGLHAFVMMVAFLVVKRPVQDVTIGGVPARFGYDLGTGFWLMLGGSAALALGAVIRNREVRGPAGN